MTSYPVDLAGRLQATTELLVTKKDCRRGYSCDSKLLLQKPESKADIYGASPEFMEIA